MLRLATRAPGLGQPPVGAAAAAPHRRRARPDDRRRAPGCSPPSPSSATSASRRGELARLAGVSTARRSRAWRPQGVLVREAAARDAPYPPLDPARRAAPAVAGAGRGRRRRCAPRSPPAAIPRRCCKGVTGSGKTEVYLEAVAEALAPRPAGAGAPARDRALGRVPRPGRGPLRRPAGRVALGRHPGRPPPRLARGRRRRGAARRRRALGAVPAVRRPRARRRRRGARRLLQAGGRRALPRPRHGGAARLDRGRRRGPRLGHALARDPGPTPRPASTPGSTCPSASASPCCRRCAAIDLRERRARPGPLDLARRWPRPSPSGWPPASSRCCSSTAAAMRR